MWEAGFDGGADVSVVRVSCGGGVKQVSSAGRLWRFVSGPFDARRTDQCFARHGAGGSATVVVAILLVSIFLLANYPADRCVGPPGFRGTAGLSRESHTRAWSVVEELSRIHGARHSFH